MSHFHLHSCLVGSCWNLWTRNDQMTTACIPIPANYDRLSFLVGGLPAVYAEVMVSFNGYPAKYVDWLLVASTPLVWKICEFVSWAWDDDDDEIPNGKSCHPFMFQSPPSTWCMAGWFKKQPRHHVDQHESLGFAVTTEASRESLREIAGWFWILMSQEYEYIIYMNPSSSELYHLPLFFHPLLEKIVSCGLLRDGWTVSWNFISYMAMGSVLPSVVPGHPMGPVTPVTPLSPVATP